MPVARVPVHVHSSVVCALQVHAHAPTRLTPFLFIFQRLARNPPPATLAFSLVPFQRRRNDNSPGWTTEGGEIGNYPFECADYLAIFPPSLSTFWLLRLVCFCSRLSFARETRCGNKGWFFIVFSCQLSQVNPCFDSRIYLVHLLLLLLVRYKLIIYIFHNLLINFYFNNVDF